MSIDPSELPGLFDSVKAAAEDGVRMGTTMMLDNMQQKTRNILRTGPRHAPGTFYKAVPGASPAYVTGNLAKSIMRSPVFSGGALSYGYVFSDMKYAALQEFGGRTWPNNSAFMHWRNDRGSWFKRMVRVPKHPYFEPAVLEGIRDGSFTRSAMTGFGAAMATVIGP